MKKIYSVIKILKSFSPNTKQDLLDFFINYEIIDSHNTESIVIIIDSDDHKYALKIECGIDSATKVELEWYQKYKMKYLESVFVSGGYNKYFSYIITSFIKSSMPLSKVLGNGYDTRKISDVIKVALKSDESLYNSTKENKSCIEQFKDVRIKFENRKNESMQFDYLKNLFDQSEIMINNKHFMSPELIIELLESNPFLINILFFDGVGVIHGDLHPGNIILSGSDEKIYYLDPGIKAKLPIQYDYGKILQTIHSGYEKIMSGNYKLSYVEEEGYYLDVGWDDDKLYEEVVSLWGEGLLKGSLFMEAMHFITMTPHHAKNEPEATALYLTGVIKLNELYESLYQTHSSGGVPSN